jgi:gliding motility-associated-like protein
MSNNSNIEEQFKNAFEHFEADVNPQVWTSIEQSLPAASTPSVDASSIVKGVVGSGKLSLLTIGIAATVITGIVAVSYLIINSSKQETIVSTRVPEQKPIVASVPVNNENTVTREESAPLVKAEEKVLVDPIVQNPKAIISPTTSDKSIVAMNSNASTYEPTAGLNDEKTLNTISKENKNADPVTSNGSADEKHENISSPAIDTESEIVAKSNINESFDWGLIPNAFSPNADGKNDVFKITNPNIESLKVTIMDRNGKQVHEWNGINGFWDGKDLNGNDLPKGVYYYFIFATSNSGEALKTKGIITLLR